MSIYTYAVARAFEPHPIAGLRGVDGAPVQLVRHDDLVAVVSEMPSGSDPSTLAARLEDLAGLERVARSHHAVVDAVAAHTVTLPFRLGTIHSDRDRASELLGQRRRQFDAALARIADRVELGVKVYARPSDVEMASDVPASTSPGRDYLRRRQTATQRCEERRRQVAGTADQIRRDLAELAADHRVHRLQDPRLSQVPGDNVLNAAYLVDEERVGGFLARVGDLNAVAAGVETVVTGPWAPYSFAALEEESAP